ncbi:MAG: uncharacterized protein A8A55_2902 [Amphiamblys sp. WSBS2006]|nr:MAG: uncharacterized protein A8A55_2902 [Amphiamblys sp. WSBS2006]
MLGKENRSICIDMVKNLELHGHAIEILLKLKFHKERAMESLLLRADNPEQITKLRETEDNSILLGRANNFYVYYFSIDALPELEFQEVPVIHGFWVIANTPEQVAGILERNNGSIPIVKATDLRAGDILQKLKLPDN